MPARVRFGVFEWEPSARELRKRGMRLSVPGQSLSILEMLVERPGEVVTREEIRERLWPDGTVVEFEHSVSSAVNRLRAALSDSATSPRYVETLPRKGYRFVAAVESEPAAVTEQRNGRPLWTVWAAGVVALVFAGSLAWKARPAATKSIAVLPFVNLSEPAGQEHLVEGLTEELIARLSMSPSLRVVSRTSAMRYAGVTKSVSEIARELGVGAVVEGSLQRSEGRVRVTAQLIDAVTDRHLWSRSYDRKAGDILALRDDVAAAIAEELKAQLLPRAASASVHPDAYEAFLKGKYFAARMNRPGQVKAVAYFEDAVRLDPGFAPAWASLSHAIGYLEFWDDVPAGERCRYAMRRALELDPTLAEALLNEADVKFYYEWKWAEGEAAFRRIVEQAPGSADARDHYAVCLRALGRYREAASEAREAARLDPLSPGMISALGLALRAAGRRLEAIESLHRAIELDPSYSNSHQLLGATLEEAGRPDEAVAAYLKAQELGGRRAEECDALRRVYVQGGLPAFARAVRERRLASLQQRSKTQRVSPKTLAQAYAAVGDNQQALNWLEEAFRQRCPTLALIRSDQGWDPLRQEPRFREVTSRMGLK